MTTSEGNLYWFNPCNDMALAADVAPYQPPAKAAEFALGGAALPLWWARKGDVVLGTADAAWLRQMRSDYGLEAEMTESPTREGLRCRPWGWSRDALMRFQRLDSHFAKLPGVKALHTLRLLSHRRTSLRLMRLLDVERRGQEFTDTREALRFIADLDGRAYIKSPWSSTGRGVRRAEAMTAAAARVFVEGTIKGQGSVIVEPEWAKTLDFAALFMAERGVVRFYGWSVFTSDGGRYAGNLSAPQERLSEQIPTEAHGIIPHLERMLTHLFSEADVAYSGPLGVDMLWGGEGLNPCVELNLRRTMGFAAADIHCRTGLCGLLAHAPDAEGLRVTPRTLTLVPLRSGKA